MKQIISGELIFFRILIPVVLGIFLAMSFPQIRFVVPLLAAFTALLLFFCLMPLYRKFRLYQKRWIPGALVHIIISLFAFALTQSRTQILNARHFSKCNTEALIAVISSEPKRTGDILRFETEVCQALGKNEFHSVCGKLLIALKIDSNLASEWSYGDKLLVPAIYSDVDPPFNPQEFNYKSFLASRGIYQQAFLSSEQVRMLDREQGNPLVALSLKLRRNMVSAFSDYMQDQDALAVASTLILGYRASLSAEIVSAYSKTGTMHVLSVSGMHVALVLGILTNLLWFMKKNKRLKLLQAVLIVSLIWFYSLITGFSPSVCRAALMISVLIIGKAFNRKINTYNLLSASAVLLLLYDPWFLVDTGFQLSYLAVFGLLFFYPRIYHLIYLKNRLADKVWSYMALSLAAQLSTFPLAMYYFNQFPLYFLLSNLLIVFPVEVIMYSGLTFLLVHSFSALFVVPCAPVLHFSAAVLETSIKVVNRCLLYIEKLPYASISCTKYPLSFYLLLLVFIILLTQAFSGRSKLVLYSAFSVLMALAVNFSLTSFANRSNSKLIFYSLRKHRAIGFIDKGKPSLFSDLQVQDKTYLFSVKPSIDATGASAVPDGYPIFRDNFLLFPGYSVLLWDPVFNGRDFLKPIKVNAVLISGNPPVQLRRILKLVRTEVLLIDGTNKDYRIKQWLKEAAGLKMPCYVLKKNPAYIVDLKS